MKRVLQALAVLQILLVVGLGARIVKVWTTPLPEFAAIPELSAPSPIPPPKPAPKVGEAMTDAVVQHDLFDEQRGVKPPEADDGGLTVEEPPVPPPSTVKLMGVMLLGGDPVAILQDTSVSPDQKSVRKGDMFGEYQIGDISQAGLLLLGSAGQQFQIPLKVEANAGAVPAGGAVVHPGAPGAPTPPKPPVPGKPVTAQKVPPQRPEGAEAEQKNMSARERAQAIAQRNAELRKGNQKGAGGPGGPGGAEANKPDPVQARLEALRQLREAAKSR